MVDENHNISTIYMCGRRKWQQLCAVRIEQVPRYLGTCGIAAKFRYPGTNPSYRDALTTNSEDGLGLGTQPPPSH